MPSRAEQSFNRIIPSAMRFFGVEIQFERGGQISKSFTSRRNEFQHQVLGAEYGLEVKILVREYIFSVQDCKILGVLIEPRTGDRIKEGGSLFEIQPPDENTPSVALIEGGYEYRVYTKQVE